LIELWNCFTQEATPTITLPCPFFGKTINDKKNHRRGTDTSKWLYNIKKAPQARVGFFKIYMVLLCNVFFVAIIYFQLN
jgi:hypothetical protein